MCKPRSLYRKSDLASCHSATVLHGAIQSPSACEMDVAQSVSTRRQQSQLPDQLPFRNEDADLFSFLDGLGTDQTQQNNGDSAAAARGGKAAFLTSVPSWGFAPQQDPSVTASSSASLPGMGMQPATPQSAPLSSLPLPDIPMGGLPLSEDNLFLTSLGASTRPTYPYQMGHELQLPSSSLNGPHAGAPARDMPGMPMWTQGPLSSPPLKEDDLGGFMPVPSGQALCPALSMASERVRELCDSGKGLAKRSQTQPSLQDLHAKQLCFN